MDYGTLLVLTLFFILGILSTIQDIRERKVSNSISFSLLGIALIFFLFNLRNFTDFDFLFLAVGILLSYLLYHHSLWGAADGKIFLAITLLLLAYSGYIFYLIYILVLLISYSLSISALSLWTTKMKDKKDIIRRIAFFEELIILEVFFIVLLFVTYFVELKANLYIFIGFLVLMYLLGDLFGDSLRKLMRNIPRKGTYALCLILVIPLITNPTLLFFFPIAYGVKIYIILISRLSDKIEGKKGKYYSPFTLYLFLSLLISLFLPI